MTIEKTKSSLGLQLAVYAGSHRKSAINTASSHMLTNENMRTVPFPRVTGEWQCGSDRFMRFALTSARPPPPTTRLGNNEQPTHCRAGRIEPLTSHAKQYRKRTVGMSFSVKKHIRMSSSSGSGYWGGGGDRWFRPFMAGQCCTGLSH